MLKEKLRLLAKAVEQDFIKDLSDKSLENSWTHESDRYNDFTISGEYRSDEDSDTYAFTKAHKEHQRELQKEIYADFLASNKDKFPEGTEVITYDNIRDTEFESEFTDYENDSLYPAILNLQLIDIRDREVIKVSLSINYTNNIMIGHADDNIFEFELTHEEIMYVSQEDFIALLESKFKPDLEHRYTIEAVFAVHARTEDIAISMARHTLGIHFDCLDSNVTIVDSEKYCD
jgi:hypothetical protein